MTDCCGEPTAVLYAGADWTWRETTDDDVSGWSDPIVEFVDVNGRIYASTVEGGSWIGVRTDGGIGEGDGELPATNFANGVWTWWISGDDNKTPPATLTMRAAAVVNGVRTVVREVTYRVRAGVAWPVEVGS